MFCDHKTLGLGLYGGYQFIDKEFSSGDKISAHDLNALAAIDLNYKISSKWHLRCEYQLLNKELIL